jgi:hypothetical protein
MPASGRLMLAAFVLLSITRPATAHVSLDYPNGGETFTGGEVVTIQWHIYIAHTLVDWDLWYTTEDGTTYTPCADQPGDNWIPIEMDFPRTCTNAGGGCGTPGGCMMQYQWTVPDGINSSQVKIRVRMDNAATDYYDVSNQPFTITSSTSAPELLSTRGLDLWQNYPNPFAATSTIAYALARDAEDVRLTVHDAAGRLLRVLVGGAAGQGAHFVVWDGTSEEGRRLPAGTYYYTLRTSGQTMTRRLVLLD